MKTLLYTDSDKIRGALGLTPQDVTDDQICNANIEARLQEDLDGWLPTHATVQTEGRATAATAAQKRAWLQLQLYCQFRAALFFTPILSTLVAQKIADGQMEMQRFSNAKLSEIEEGMRTQADHYQELLSPSLDADGVPFTAFGVSTPGSDPVTNT